jgi:hypothetical protein
MENNEVTDTIEQLKQSLERIEGFLKAVNEKLDAIQRAKRAESAYKSTYAWGD